jgi:hypothetical protein
MKKHKTMLFAMIIVSMTFFFNGLGCARPLGLTINNNKEMAKLIPVLRKDAPLIIEKLEILRLGLSEKNEYMVYLDEYEDGYQIKFSDHYNFGYQFYNFSERPEKFSTEEIDAINYLLLSDELQMNASSIHFYLGAWSPPYAVFARDRDGWYALGIYYIDPNKEDTSLEVFRRLGDYVEELKENYWLVMWFRQRG